MAKQVILIRKDLKMRRGKELAQGAHASHMALGLTWPLTLKSFRNFWGKVRWLRTGHKKIAVYVNSEESLHTIMTMAERWGLPNATVVDNGHTEFHGVKTVTAGAIGPCDDKWLETLTNHLPLM